MAENRSQKLRGPKGPGGRRGMGPKVKLEHPGQTIKRLLKYIGKSYGVYMVLVLILIIVSVLANVQGTMFTKSLIDDYITPLQRRRTLRRFCTRLFRSHVFTALVFLQPGLITD